MSTIDHRGIGICGENLQLKSQLVRTPPVVGVALLISGAALVAQTTAETLVLGLVGSAVHLAGWVVNAQQIKPGSQMPPNILPADDLQALIAYLESLK